MTDHIQSYEMPEIQGYDSPLDILVKCGGYYKARRNPDTGRFETPLAGYAGRYGEEEKQYVGIEFANFAMIEQWPRIVDNYIVPHLVKKVQLLFGRESSSGLPAGTSFCGAPEGGKTLATLLGRDRSVRYFYPEKVEVQAATATSRPKSALKFKRHDVRPGERVLITEDVCNNYTTTAELIGDIESCEASVAGIVCYLNRSPRYREGVYIPDKPGLLHGSYPIISLWDQAMPVYRQDDPLVAADVAANNVAWKPKDKWDDLQRAMFAA